MLDSLRRIASAVRQTLLEWTFVVLDAVVPVRDDFWCFCTWGDYPHTLDNPRAVFEEVKDDPSLHKFVLQKKASPPPVREGTSVDFVSAESLRGAYVLARSRVVLLGYALFGLSSYSRRLDASRHEVVQLWHGVPLKRIGHLFPGDDFWEDETERYAATVCSSDRDREVMARAFAPVPRERVWPTGLPRNSLILEDEDRLPADYRRHLHDLDERLDGRRLVVYAPTWRESTDDLYSFSRDEVDALEGVFSRHDAVLGVRGHPKVREAEAYSARSGSDAVFSVDDLPDPNVLLRRTDVLVTDYSSIYIDFLLLDRPVLHFAYDLEAYRSERGFLYEPEDAFAGPCPKTFDELLEHLDETLANPDAHADQREQARSLFHEHPDDSAREVVARIARLARAGPDDGQAVDLGPPAAARARESAPQRRGSRP